MNWVILCIAIALPDTDGNPQEPRFSCKAALEDTAILAGNMCRHDPVFDCTPLLSKSKSGRPVITLFISDVARLTAM